MGNGKSREGVPILRKEEDPPSQEGKYGKHHASKHPGWEAKVIGPKIYHVATKIMSEIGNDSRGRKISSRGTSEEECGSVTWIDEEDGDRYQSVIGFSLSKNESCNM